jgi:hypothetical protein
MVWHVHVGKPITSPVDVAVGHEPLFGQPEHPVEQMTATGQRSPVQTKRLHNSSDPSTEAKRTRPQAWALQGTIDCNHYISMSETVERWNV